MKYPGIGCLLLIALLLLSSAGCSERTGSRGEPDQIDVISSVDQEKSAPLFIDGFEGGQAYRTSSGTFLVLDLSTSRTQMGRQYGGLAGEDLRTFHDRIVADITGRGVAGDYQLATAQGLYDGYPPSLQELLQGMIQISGLTMDEVLVVNAGMLLLTDAILAERRRVSPMMRWPGAAGSASGMDTLRMAHLSLAGTGISIGM